MPSFFQFTQGTESRLRHADSSPLLGRFRAVPPQPGLSQAQRQLGLLSDRLSRGQDGGRGSVHVGYGALAIAAGIHHDDSESSDEDSSDDGSSISSGEGNGRGGARRSLNIFKPSRHWRKAWRRYVFDLWVEPRQSAVKRIVNRWWSRYGALVFLPAALAVGWCSIPFPQYPLPDVDRQDGHISRLHATVFDEVKAPGHGQARVRVNFWFFLFVYYGFYNLTALVWITKVFNLYNFNWWPSSLGFPLTISLIAVLATVAPIPIYFSPSSIRFLIKHNTAWILWTFNIMAMPVAIAFLILLTNERHVGLRNTLSETQRLFTTSWWVGEPDTLPRADQDRRRRNRGTQSIQDELLFEPDVLQITGHSDSARAPPPPRGVKMRRRWLPASFVRFLWFCVAMFIGLMAYVIGEAYAEVYLRTLPHNTYETIGYVYGWVATIHLLDALTGWVLGVREGERVGSYPLNWIFKLYFMLTYQTYVRALYARLRSPQQFVILQILSSTGLVVITPLMMTELCHRLLTILGFNTLSYGTYQKLQVRNVFIRFLAENTSMATFLGSVLVLHFGANKNVYPYFAFDDKREPYDFNLTFYASMVTWGCELVASLVVRLLIRLSFGVDVGLEGKLDLVVWPELLPTAVVVMLHVLQNMLFSIIRLQFV